MHRRPFFNASPRSETARNAVADGGGLNTAPLDAAGFEALLAPLSPGRRVALAVSGGGDSTALLRLAAEWTRLGACAGGTHSREILAYTVDHGLRAGARAEADAVAAACARLGVAHRILEWRGEKPTEGLQARARAARYRLLATACAEDGCGDLITAHTLDDQAETLFQRLARGAGVDGLAAMRPARAIAAGAGPAVRLLRPLLTVSRAQLRATCTAFGETWAEDPGNADTRYERVRVRNVLTGLAAQDIVAGEALLRSAARAAAAADGLDTAVRAAFDAAAGVFLNAGCLVFDAERAARLAEVFGEEIAGRLAARAVRAVSGARHRPDGADALRLLRGEARTLGGCLTERCDGRLFVCREPAALLGRAGVPVAEPLSLASGAPTLWDGRFIVQADALSAAAEGDLTVCAAGPEGLSAIESARPGLLSATGLPQAVLAATPVVEMAGRAVAAPTLGWTPEFGASARFLGAERLMDSVIRY